MMETIKLTIEGMSCEHCVQAVTSALSGLEGIFNVKVDLATKSTTIEFNPDLVALTEIKKVITDEGYRAV